MKTHRTFIASAVALTLTAGLALAADIKSGPQVNKTLPGPFHPLNVTGEAAGKKNCLYCSNGNRPVAMIFARKVTPEVTRLIKAIDAANAKRKDTMGSFVVFLSDKDGLEKELKGLAAKNKIGTCVLSIDNPAGPKGYEVSKDAAVTVVLYRERTVKANHAFKAGELKDKDIKAIVADLSKILKD